MERSKPHLVWEVQNLLCYLSYHFKDFSCFFREKALGPMPPRRENIQHFARSFSNMSTLLLFASTKLSEEVLRYGTVVEGWNLLFGLFPEADHTFRVSLFRLFEVWEVIESIFGKLKMDLALWSRNKTKSQLTTSPLNADYKAMAEVLSYAEVALCEILSRLNIFLGSSFEIDSQM
jgi:hypothetical protein